MRILQFDSLVPFLRNSLEMLRCKIFVGLYPIFVVDHVFIFFFIGFILLLRLHNARFFGFARISCRVVLVLFFRLFLEDLHLLKSELILRLSHGSSFTSFGLNRRLLGLWGRLLREHLIQLLEPLQLFWRERLGILAGLRRNHFLTKRHLF